MTVNIKKPLKLKAVKPSSAEPSKPKILIFGKPGVGKTWTALDFPKPYYIDTEGGADLKHYTDKLEKVGGAYLGQEQGSLDFKEILEQVQALAITEHDYKTLVIDSVSKIFNTVIANESERLGSADQYGASKKPAVSYMRQLINWLDRLDMTVILIAHEKPLWGTDAKGNRNEVGTTFDAWEKLEYELHLCLNIVKQGDSRLARIQKSRLTGFQSGASFDWSYNKFAELYGKDIIEKKSTQLVLATQDQLERLDGLMKNVKIDDDWLEKCLTKAKANKIEEMDESKVETMIKFLQERIAI